MYVIDFELQIRTNMHIFFSFQLYSAYSRIGSENIVSRYSFSMKTLAFSILNGI